MVIELASFTVLSNDDSRRGFSEAFYKSKEDLFKKAEGYLDAELYSTAENPDEFVLLVKWRALADHMEGFRKSDAFLEWRRRITPFLASDPVVKHLLQ